MPAALNAPIPFEIGPYRLTLLDTGRFALDGGAMYGVVPKPVWEKLTPPDAKNRVALALNCLLIEYEGEKILFETGIGAKFNEKYQDLYGIAQYSEFADRTPIEFALNQIGVSPQDINRVYLSHLHFDHAGGATRCTADGTVIPTFENAQYYVHQGEWEYGTCPHERCKASYLKENFQALQDRGQLTLLEDDITAITPELSLRKTGGHTPYHQVMILDVPDATPSGFIFWADVLPTRHHVRIPFVMGYDEYPIETMAIKRALLQEAAEKGWLHIFEHEIDHPVCRLTAEAEADRYQIHPFTPATCPA